MQSVRLEAGELRHRVSILQQNLTQDSFGGWKQEDTSVFAQSVPAKIETLSGRELYAAQQKVTEVTHRVTVRWQRGIEAKMKILWFDEIDRFFSIEAVENPTGIRVFLSLLCVEIDDSARTNE